ncbi:AbrB/MazE/SpoVT family DNA-binding domain-containing protein [Candidatus Woesearchaeota archaeon]|nr:AbrB/MazE/SpoVT family DNA-binding domain-containing protein [Candidatus Woesearchaeota archaeon]MBW3005478.1 AbrB/MazE/SpoVT family DNA-binding domain-containing protein [Candidatus Woesearchaeota archaeon]
MKRKVNRVGINTLTVSLPSKWAKLHNIKPGDELDVVEENNTLSIIKGQFAKKKKEIHIDMDNLDYFTLAKLLIACYEESYDSIKLTFSKKTIQDSVTGEEIDIFRAIDRLVGRLPTFQIFSQSNERIMLGDISEKLSKLDIIISRVFFLIEEYLLRLIEDIKTGDFADLNAREPRHDSIAKQIALANRILMDDASKSKSEIVNTILVLNYLDKATDFIRYGYKHTQRHNKKISKSGIKLMEDATEYIKLFRTCYNKCEYNNINKLDILRSKVKKANQKIASANPSELIIVSNLKCLVELLNGAVKAVIAIKLDKEN